MIIYLKFIVLFLCSVLIQWGIIAIFKKKKLFQHIYELSPQTHQAKASTPSLGGVGILISLWIACAMIDVTLEIFWLMALYSVFACIGLYDDSKALLNKKNQGLKTIPKFCLQLILAIVFVFLFHQFIDSLSIVDALLYGFIIVGASNATNLTDGLDGLLGGCSLITCCGFLWFLQLTPVHSLSLFITNCMVIIVAFLLFNKNPAKIFMGDTGSLALGALFAGIVMVIGNIWLLLALGAIYVLETLSVIIQVGYYKRTKKRVFLMAPLHHHFELMGLSERNVVHLFWFVAIIFMVIGIYFS